MSGLAWVVLTLVGIVAGGDSETLQGISTYRWPVAGSVSQTLERRRFRTELCLHVYRPWIRAYWHPFRMWADVGVGELHNGHLLQTRFFKGWISENFGPGNQNFQDQHSRNRAHRQSQWQELLFFLCGKKLRVVVYFRMWLSIGPRCTTIVLDIENYPSARMSCCADDLVQLLPCLDFWSLRSDNI